MTREWPVARSLTFKTRSLSFDAMLKAVLSILAVIGLLLSPIHAQAAQADCMAMDAKMTAAAHAMASTDMSSCCDKDMAKSSKDNSKNKACIDNCIAMCSIGTAVASDGSLIRPVLAVRQIAFNAKASPLFTQELGLVVPPPKSQA